MRALWPDRKEKNARHPEGGTKDGIKDSDEEDVQDGDEIMPSSKAVLLVSHRKESKTKAIHWTEEVLIYADEVSKEKDLPKENELILHHPYHTDLCNEAECEGNDKSPNIHEGSASGNVREMELVLSPDK